MPDLPAVGAAYLAAPGFETVLLEELARRSCQIVSTHGRLVLTANAPIDACWALDTWTAPSILPAPSIGAAATALRALQRNWSGYHSTHHRRAALIQDRLPPIRFRRLTFPEPAPTAPLGGWTLLDAGTLLASTTKSSSFANGECLFEEDRAGPPSRAYLKFWEACTRLGLYPDPGESCIDLGASPGGWSWAAAMLGANVLAVDKAPLAETVSSLPNVRWTQGSAFTLEPRPVDWLISDVIAYPDRLLALVQRWMPVARRIVCTVKFQGETDHAAADAFAALPGARLMHLLHNKHELTLLWTDGS